jgi:flagellar hook-associated protein FlgK
MSEFWSAWQDLPIILQVLRKSIGKSENLTNTFNTIYSDLVGIQDDIDLNL